MTEVKRKIVELDVEELQLMEEETLEEEVQKKEKKKIKAEPHFLPYVSLLLF
ncbi:MAG: hypothetical protein ACFFAN_11620 [Promethearchaeota archaeon]